MFFTAEVLDSCGWLLGEFDTCLRVLITIFVLCFPFRCSLRVHDPVMQPSFAFIAILFICATSGVAGIQSMPVRLQSADICFQSTHRPVNTPVKRKYWASVNLWRMKVGTTPFPRNTCFVLSRYERPKGRKCTKNYRTVQERQQTPHLYTSRTIRPCLLSSRLFPDAVSKTQASETARWLLLSLNCECEENLCEG